MRRPLLEPGGDSAELLQAAHQTLNSVTLPVERGIEAVPAVQGALIAPARDHRADAPPGQYSSHARVVVASVAHHGVGPVLWTACTGASHAPEVQERLQIERFVAFAPGEEERHRFAAALGAQVDLGGEAPARASESLVLLAPHGPSSVLVSANDRTIDEVFAPVQFAAPVGLALECPQHALPYTRCGPPPESAVRRAPGTEVARQVTPGRSGTEHPQDAADDEPVIARRATRAGALGRKQWSESLPLRIGQLNSFAPPVLPLRIHAPNLPHLLATSRSSSEHLRTS